MALFDVTSKTFTIGNILIVKDAQVIFKKVFVPENNAKEKVVKEKEEYKFGNILMRYFKNISIGMFFPFIIILGISIPNDDFFYSFLSMFLFLLPCIIFILLFIIYRNRYYLIDIDLIEKNKVLIGYTYFLKRKFILTNEDSVSFNIRRDKSTLFEYYVFEVFVDKKLLMKQYQYGKWNLKKFRTLALHKSLSLDQVIGVLRNVAN